MRAQPTWMRSYRLVGLVGLVVAMALATGCHLATSPELRVVGVHDGARDEVVFVQVKNPANHPMHLTKLDYTFAAEGATVSEGELDLQRDIPAGAVVVVEVPLKAAPTKLMTLQGTLTAELDQMVQTFAVSAEIQPH